MPRVIFHTINNRIPIQAITVTQLMELLRVGMLETGPSAEQMAENGGRAAATLCLQRLNLKSCYFLSLLINIRRRFTKTAHSNGPGWKTLDWGICPCYC